LRAIAVLLISNNVLLVLIAFLAFYFRERIGFTIWSASYGINNAPASGLIVLAFVYSLLSLLAVIWFYRYTTSLSEETQRAYGEMLKSERFRTELITNVSHDIRTPLTSLINYVDLLKAVPDKTQEISDYTAVLDRQAHRLKGLVDDLMDASKAGTGNVDMHIEPIDLLEIVSQVSGEFDKEFSDIGLSLVLKQPEKPIIALADSKQLYRVLINLFSNAAKYSTPGTRVYVQTAQDEEGARFSISNTSKEVIGVRAEDLSEQFIRGDGARQSEGSGLGLYIAKSLMQLMGGNLRISTLDDHFCIELLFSEEII
jgi:signal transduction histidine kinase